jgi:hypothetical protein
LDVVIDSNNGCTIRVGALRGRYSNDTDAHAWNIIQLDVDAPIFIADGMRSPHKLIPVDSKQALLYKSGAGHVGMKALGKDAHNGALGRHVFVRAIDESQCH